MGDPVIAVSDITRRYGAKTALSNVSSPPRGGVYGLVGANGAGKTTLIKHSDCCVRSRGPHACSASIRSPIRSACCRASDIFEEHDLPTWMRVDELMNYSRALFPAWDVAYAAERGRPSASTATRASARYRKARRRVSACWPRWRTGLSFVLDEPSSGLDLVVRRDIVEAIMRTIAHEGRTVLFSSHLLDEVERTADHVTMINEGRVVLSGPLVELKRAHGNASLDDIFAAHAGTRLTTQ